MRNALLVAPLLMLLTAVVLAASQDGWVEISTTSDNVFEGRSGSVEFMETSRTKERVIAVTIRVRHRKTHFITFEKNYVRLTDCATGHGKLVTTDMNGNWKHDNDFVLDGGTVASQIADLLCRIAGAPEGIAPATRY